MLVPPPPPPPPLLLLLLLVFPSLMLVPPPPLLLWRRTLRVLPRCPLLVRTKVVGSQVMLQGGVEWQSRKGETQNVLEVAASNQVSRLFVCSRHSFVPFVVSVVRSCRSFIRLCRLLLVSFARVVHSKLCICSSVCP